VWERYGQGCKACEGCECCSGGGRLDGSQRRDYACRDVIATIYLDIAVYLAKNQAGHAAGHTQHASLPVEDLYVPDAQIVHVPPFGPV